MPGCDFANLSAIKLNIMDTGWLTIKLLILNGNNEHIGDIILILRLFFQWNQEATVPITMNLKCHLFCDSLAMIA